MNSDWQILVAQGEHDGGPIPDVLLWHIQEARPTLSELEKVFIAALGDDFVVGTGSRHIWIKRKEDANKDAHVFFAREKPKYTSTAILAVAEQVWRRLESLVSQLDPGHYILCEGTDGTPQLKRVSENITSQETSWEVSLGGGAVGSPEALVEAASDSFIFATNRLLEEWGKCK